MVFSVLIANATHRRKGSKLLGLLKIKVFVLEALLFHVSITRFYLELFQVGVRVCFNELKHKRENLITDFSVVKVC